MLKDMAYTKAEAKEEQAEETGTGDLPKYPWCLSLYLNDEVLKKLGMDAMPGVGTDLLLTAKVQVTGTSTRQNLDSEAENCVDLQITAMDLSKSMTTDERQMRAAGKLYGTSTTGS